MSLWKIENHVRFLITVNKTLYRIPVIGKVLGLISDRVILFVYGLNMGANTIDVKRLRCSYPNMVSLASYGIRSPGTVVVNAGTRFTIRRPDCPRALEKIRNNEPVFELGDNVVIGTYSILIGPLKICDDVIIGAHSIVNRDIDEPGVYAGVPAVKISARVNRAWADA